MGNIAPGTERTDPSSQNICHDKGPAYPRTTLGNAVRPTGLCQARGKSDNGITHRMARIACDAIIWTAVRLVSQECRHSVGY